MLDGARIVGIRLGSALGNDGAEIPSCADQGAERGVRLAEFQQASGLPRRVVWENRPVADRAPEGFSTHTSGQEADDVLGSGTNTSRPS